MSLYAIGDLHLHFQSELKAPGQLHGKVWQDHERKFKENCEALMTNDDTLVLAWDAKKTERLNEQFAGKLQFLQNNYYSYGDYALVGTKGYTFEGPFYLDRYGNVCGWDEQEAEHAEKLVGREIERLRVSFEKAKADGYRKFIMFLHYPPTNVLQDNSAFTKMAEKYGAEQVIYGHCHGESRFHDSIRGKKRGIRYGLVSGDCLRWHPMKVLE